MKLLSSLARSWSARLSGLAAQRPPQPRSWHSSTLRSVRRASSTPKVEPVVAQTKSIIAVTACPTGIAHTFRMAADALKLAAETPKGASDGRDPGLLGQHTTGRSDHRSGRRGHLRHRRRGQGPPALRRQAGDRLRVKRAINEPDTMIAEAVAAADNPNAARVEGTAASAAAGTPSGNLGWGTRIRQILLTGVSYMIPFVAAGGLLIALGFPAGRLRHRQYARRGLGFAGHIITTTNSLTKPAERRAGPVSGCSVVHVGRLGIRVPGAGAGRLHLFAIADRPGLAPGFTAGAVALYVGAGFIGGIVGGLIAGFAALWISGWRVPQWFRGLMPVVVIPLAGHADRRPVDVPLARPAAGGGHRRSDPLAQRALRRVGGPARNHLGLDDVLRPRRPGEQGGLCVRHRGPEHRRTGLPADHGGRRGAAWCHRWPWHWPPRCAGAVQRTRTGEWPGRLASGCVVHLRGAIPFAAADPLR